MHLAQQLQRPLQRAAAGTSRSLGAVLCSTTGLEGRLARLRIACVPSSPAPAVVVQGRRYASVKSQGAYKVKSKKTIPKKMGAKKTGDQYVIPGNIIYKQRGTIWHPGENTIMGRDHTIHAAVAGYVKYYRDPHRHPDRKYIGVAFNREDKLPYPPGTPRRRKLGLVAVPRSTEEPVQETMSPSGIPLAVTRHEHVEQPMAEAGTSGAAGTSTPVSASAQAGQDSDNKAAPAPAPAPEPESEPVRLTDGNAVVSSLIKDKLRSRAAAQARREARRQQQLRELEARKGTRVFRLQPDYSYRETNWEIGRLVGDVGSVPGAEKTESRKAKFRLRRRKRVVYFRGLKKRKLAKVARREEYRRRVREKRARRIQQRAEAAAALKAAAAAAAAAKPKEDAAKDNKVEA